MSSPSNLYAEKIFAEHPISLWALDDKLDYVSLIDEPDRKLEDWIVSNATVTSSLSALEPRQPFTDSYVNEFYGEVVPESTTEVIEFISPLSMTLNKDMFNQELGTFAFGFYLYADNPYLSSIQVGYRYFNDALNDYVEPETKYFNQVAIEGRWMLISDTFEIPNAEENFQLIIRVEYVGGALLQADNKFIINGMSLGQWSENFLSESLGVSVLDMPAEVPITGFSVVEASAYGLVNDPGYYLTSSNSLFAKNASLPMVYGTANVTVLSPNNNAPSLIVPGYGFLGEYGRYKEYTLEAWLKISSETVTPKRILGPISSIDGLYVDGPFIALQIGNSYKSHYISEWDRPMLVHIRVSEKTASLLINSEEVLSIDIDADHEYPTKIVDGKNHDWIGIYSYSDVSPIELDCIAIYPYLVSKIVAKRRWVYGQAVEVPENINRSYSGTSAVIDYQFSKYANNYIYPDYGKWDQGIVDNLVSQNGQLSLPAYGVPQSFFDNKTSAEWEDALQSIQNEDNNFISLRPNSSWSNTNGYLYLNNLDLLYGDTKAIYVIFKQKVSDQSPKTLVKIVDELTSSYFEIRLAEDSIEYILKYEANEELIVTTQKHYYSEIFVAGVDINKMVSKFGGNLSSFFGRKSSLSAYIGGNKDFSKTFDGNIYAVGFCSSRNLTKIPEAFSDDGIISDQVLFPGISDGIYDAGDPSTSVWDETINADTTDYAVPATVPTVDILDHVASYTLKLLEQPNRYVIDVSSNAYWEDYLPLKYFAKYVKDQDGNMLYDIDFLQLNINYPSPSTYVETTTTDSWTYEELQEQFAHPVQRTYDDLDNYLFSGFETYEDLAQKTVRSYAFDTSKNILRSYVTFQYLSSGLNNTYSYFSNIVAASKDGVISPGSNGEDWQVSKYEFVDGMIVYPPAGISLEELAIVVHIELIVDGINKKPIKIKKLHISSQCLDHTSPTAIGTRFGQEMYPYRKSGIYYNYKGMNPFRIYNGSSPHLYLTKKSGIEIVGEYDPAVDRGISIPVNPGLSTEFKVIASQMSIRFNKDFFPFGRTKLFEIQSKNAHLKFYALANHPSGKRAKIYAINAKTGKKENGIAFYWNGKLTREPNITVKEWGMLGIRFSNTLNFTNYAGAIRLTGPVMFNNVSHYQSTNLQEVQLIATRPWIKVKTSGITNFDWDYWESAFIWNGVLVISETSFYGVDPSDIYKAYTGTNKVIVDDTTPLTLGNYEYNVIKDALWQVSVRSPL